MLTDLELLEIEIDTLWLKDDRGRLVKGGDAEARSAPHLVIGACRDGRIVAIGSEVPEELASDLRTVIASEAPQSDPALAPVSLVRCEHLLKASLGPAEVSSGPSYLIPRSIAYTSFADIQRSDSEDIDALQGKNPQLTWTTDEWRQLLDGDLGPWAVATIDGKVIAVGHCARLTERAAEAGVWTDPGFRGQGHAAAVTAAWASLLVPSGRRLFYSTSATNLSSQRVSALLYLRPIGWLWKLSAPRTT